MEQNKKIYRNDYMERDKKIYELRKKGRSLQGIGVVYNISRERVRQILEKYEKIPLLSVADITRIVNISNWKFNTILNKLHIEKRTRWDQDMLDKVITFMNNRKCIQCGKPISPTSQHTKYCDNKNCMVERWKYKNWSNDRKKKHAVLVKRWEMNNPETVKIIRRKSSKKHYWKMKKKSL